VEYRAIACDSDTDEAVRFFIEDDLAMPPVALAARP
jgi:hypothetical protein